MDLDLKVGLDLDLDLNIAGFAHHCVRDRRRTDISKEFCGMTITFKRILQETQMTYPDSLMEKLYSRATNAIPCTMLSLRMGSFAILLYVISVVKRT